MGRLSTHVRPLSSETVRPGATGNEYKSGDSREGTSLSVTSEGEVGGGKSVLQRVFEASVWQCWQEGGHDTEAALRPVPTSRFSYEERLRAFVKNGRGQDLAGLCNL